MQLEFGFGRGFFAAIGAEGFDDALDLALEDRVVVLPTCEIGSDVDKRIAYYLLLLASKR